jgi:outer membrane protein assembly factor BamB
MTHHRFRAVPVLISGIALLLAVAVVALVAGRPGGGAAELPSAIRFLPHPAPAGPADDLTWWVPVHGEPLGVAVDGSDVAAAALDEVRLIDRVSGRVRWKAQVAGVRRYRPALGGDRVAATSETDLVLLARADGARVATVPFAGPGPAAVLPATTGGSLVVAGSETGLLLAVDGGDGALRWSVSFPGEVTVAPGGDASTVVASWHDGAGATLRVLDGGTGTVRWETVVGPVAAPPVLVPGAVLVAGGEGIHTSTVRALDLGTGAPRWQIPLPGWWDDELEAAVDPSTAYLLDGMGTVVALDPATGRVRWRRETDRPLVDGRVVLTEGSVVFASYDDELMVLDRGDGRLRSVEPQRGVPVDLAVAGDRLVVALRLGAPSRVEARPGP